MKLAVMQPYFFPYIGYFQLLNAADTFVFYDDVNYMKGGWINRNKILVNNKAYLFTIPLSNSSSFIEINETKINRINFIKAENKFLKTIEQSYKKAPFFTILYPLLYDFFLEFNKASIAELSIDSVLFVSSYLELNTSFKISSKHYKETKGLNKVDRLIEIAKKEKADDYINPIGGKEIYDKTNFKEKGLSLQFLKSNIKHYKQYKNEFIPSLSILDVLMFNSKDKVRDMLNDYYLI